jgi:hypothetical protein
MWQISNTQKEQEESSNKVLQTIKRELSREILNSVFSLYSYERTAH